MSERFAQCESGMFVIEFAFEHRGSRLHAGDRLGTRGVSVLQAVLMMTGHRVQAGVKAGERQNVLWQHQQVGRQMLQPLDGFQEIC